MLKKVKKLNKRFFKFENELYIKSILEYLNISEEIFFKYNGKNTDLLDFKINQFSSFANSLDDSLIFVNKNISNNLRNIKGVCLIKISSQECYTHNKNIVIPSENPKLDFCNLINKFCTKKEKKN